MEEINEDENVEEEIEETPIKYKIWDEFREPETSIEKSCNDRLYEWSQLLTNNDDVTKVFGFESPENYTQNVTNKYASVIFKGSTIQLDYLPNINNKPKVFLDFDMYVHLIVNNNLYKYEDIEVFHVIHNKISTKHLWWRLSVSHINLNPSSFNLASVCLN